MKINTATLSPGDIARLRAEGPSTRVAPRNGTKAEVLIYRRGASALVLKDYTSRTWPLRNTLGRFLIRREAAAYIGLGPLEGLPAFLGRVGPYALALEWIDARPLASLTPGEVPVAAFERLEQLVERLHRKGVALGDLHHRDVLVDRAGKVWIVDLATSWALGKRPSRLRRRIFERLQVQDRIAVARMRARFLGDDEHREVIAAVGAAAATRHLRWRRIKRALDRIRRRAWV